MKLNLHLDFTCCTPPLLINPGSAFVVLVSETESTLSRDSMGAMLLMDLLQNFIYVGLVRLI